MTNNLNKIQPQDESLPEYDLFVIGGGINGMAIAADAAGRNLRVALCDKNDFGAETSSWSTKLIHGGLRYLEHYEFSLVRESLQEREILMRSAPFIIHPLAFVMPHETHLRSPLLVRIGLFFYDHLYGENSLPRSKQINLINTNEGAALKEKFTKGFKYFDCKTDDSRLVILKAMQARDHGADCWSRTEMISAQRGSDNWEVNLRAADGKTFTIKTKVLINAAGPWVDHVQTELLKQKSRMHLQLVKGSHLIVKQIYTGKHAYLFQNSDNRIIFAIPYLDEFTLIGTTDVAFKGDPHAAKISEDEINYLLNSVNEYFEKTITRDDIVSTFSGVRPLYGKDSASPADISRGYTFDLNQENNAAPLLTVYGGKLTTHRVLAEHALKKLESIFPDAGPKWTHTAPLPGWEQDFIADKSAAFAENNNDLYSRQFLEFYNKMQQKYSWLPAEQCLRYAKQYGTLTGLCLGDAASIDDLGQHFGADCYECELRYSIQYEMAQTSKDFLWRRTKLGLVLTDNEVQLVDDYFRRAFPVHG